MTTRLLASITCVALSAAALACGGNTQTTVADNTGGAGGAGGTGGTGGVATAGTGGAGATGGAAGGAASGGAAGAGATGTGGSGAMSAGGAGGSGNAGAGGTGMAGTGGGPITAMCVGTDCPGSAISFGGFNIELDGCCAGDAMDKCGIDTAGVPGGVLPPGCFEKNQPGDLDMSCPSQDVGGQFSFPGCCLPSNVCGIFVDASQFAPDLNFGCVDPSAVGGGGTGGAPQACGQTN